MIKLPVLFGVSLWLMFGTSNSAAVVQRFLQGYPSPGYMPTFPWKNNYVSSSEYVNADDSIETSLYDVSSSESVDDDESKDSSLETFYTDDHDYDPDDLYDNVYGDEPDFKDTDDDVYTDYIADSDIDDLDIDDSYIDDLDINGSDIDVFDYDRHNFDTNDLNDDDIDDLVSDIYDSDYNLAEDDADDDEEESDQQPLSNHVGGLSFEDDSFYDEQGHYGAYANRTAPDVTTQNAALHLGLFLSVFMIFIEK